MRPHVNVVRSAPMKIKNLIIIRVGVFKPGFTSAFNVSDIKLIPFLFTIFESLRLCRLTCHMNFLGREHFCFLK